MADLVDDESELAQRGLRDWLGGNLPSARSALGQLLSIGTERQSRDATFHALHLLACVAFSEGELAESRSLHEEVLAMASGIGFLAGQASSLHDIAMIDRLEGKEDDARRRFTCARDLFDQGGYSAQRDASDAALTSR